MNLSLYSPARRATGKPGEPAQSSITDEVMAKAEVAVDRLAAEYPEYARRDIVNLLFVCFPGDKGFQQVDGNRENDR